MIESTETAKTNCKEAEFPMLMVAPNGTVIIAVSSSSSSRFRGTVVHTGNKESRNERIGYYSINWLKSRFKSYNGTIELRNTP